MKEGGCSIIGMHLRDDASREIAPLFSISIRGDSDTQVYSLHTNTC